MRPPVIVPSSRRMPPSFIARAGPFLRDSSVAPPSTTIHMLLPMSVVASPNETTAPSVARIVESREPVSPNVMPLSSVRARLENVHEQFRK